MSEKDILRKIQRIEIFTNRLVNTVFAGEYESVFKGQGITFDEVREYQVGDEIRTIDWNVTARMGQAYIKKYVEERELVMMLVVDMSASTSFGSIAETKAEIAAEIAASSLFPPSRTTTKSGLSASPILLNTSSPHGKGKGTSCGSFGISSIFNRSSPGQILRRLWHSSIACSNRTALCFLSLILKIRGMKSSYV